MENRTYLLAESARFDLCGVRGGRPVARARSGVERWIYPAVLPGGRTVRLFKTLQTNVCTKDCQYCENRASRDVRRATFPPEELAGLFWELYRAGRVGGLFLSSGVAGRPDTAMATMIGTAEILRRRHGFKGYIHMKILPGASRSAVEHAARLSDRISINLEAPGPERLGRIAGEKDFLRDLLPQVEWIRRAVEDPATRARSHTTQFVVGAAGETDHEILRCSAWLYRRRGLWRAYYSGYEVPDEETRLDVPPVPSLREYRLYQADFLIRRYGFRPGELVFLPSGNLDLARDPKEAWAGAHPELFPVELMTAPREMLLRVPGLGPVTAARICALRRQGAIRDENDLKKAGVRLNRAAPYVRLKGRQVRLVP